MRSTDNEWDQYLADRKAKHFTLIQVAPAPHWAGETDRQGEKPFYDKACFKFNPAFWQAFERKVQRANEAGFVVMLVGLMEPVERYPESAAACLFARHIVARLFGNFVVFSPSFDSKFMPLADEVGFAARQATAVHLITQHPGTPSKEPTPIWTMEYYDRSYLDIAGVQTGHNGGNRQRCAHHAIQWILDAYRHEPHKPVINLEAMYDGHGENGWQAADARGGIEGDVFRVRFCPTRAGKWTIVDVKSNAAKLAGQHRGDDIAATESKLHGFWVPDDDSEGRRWYRRSDGSHQYIIGNTHYTFLTEHGRSGKPTGGNIAADMAANTKFFKKVRFGLQGGQYPHPTEKPWLDDDGRPTDDGNYSHRPNPRWFHQRVDLAVRTAFEHDLIADLILAGPDTPESRTTLKAKHNGGDASPYLRYVAARYGSFPNVWLCLCNEYDIKHPKYSQADIANLGVTIRGFLPYPTPLSVHDGSKIGWSRSSMRCLNGPIIKSSSARSARSRRRRMPSTLCGGGRTARGRAANRRSTMN